MEDLSSGAGKTVRGGSVWSSENALWLVGRITQGHKPRGRPWKGDLHGGGALELGSRLVVGVGLRAQCSVHVTLEGQMRAAVSGESERIAG